MGGKSPQCEGTASVNPASYAKPERSRKLVHPFLRPPASLLVCQCANLQCLTFGLHSEYAVRVRGMSLEQGDECLLLSQVLYPVDGFVLPSPACRNPKVVTTMRVMGLSRTPSWLSITARTVYDDTRMHSHV